MPTAAIETPLGRIGLTEKDGAIVSVQWDSRAGDPDTPLLKVALAQLAAYFDGDLTEFDLPLNPAGSDFQKDVYALMSAIPYGHTRSYGELAKDLGVAPQPVGQACGSNPIPIIIPCHRVLAAGGGLGGFSAKGGVETKVALLRREKAAGLLL